jgi:predicted permease
MKKHATPGPPKWAQKLLIRITAPDQLEELEGDLEELFQKRLPQGLRKAQAFYLLDILLLVHPRLWQRKASPDSTRPYTKKIYLDMLTHHLLLAYRSFLRFKSSFLINLVGLSTGLACALLIYLWVEDERRVDKFHQFDEQLYQVMEIRQNTEGYGPNPHSAGLLYETLQEQLPEVESTVAARLRGETQTLSAGAKTTTGKVLFASERFFSVFTFPLTQGDPNQVLRDQNSVVLSKQIARRLFGTTDNLIGKTILLDGEKPYQVSGVFEGTPARSSLQFDFVLSFEEYKRVRPNVLDWGYNTTATYVVLKKGTPLAQVNQKIARLLDGKTGKKDRSLFLTRYSDRYLYGQHEKGRPTRGRIEYVKLFSIIGLFILLIASINYTNLSTAKAISRLKEVGLKKVIGANRGTLIVQYLTESMLLTLLALLLALLVAGLLLPQFNQLTGKALTIAFDAQLVFAIVGIGVITGLLAGAYPAFYLSGFRPALILKGKLQPSAGGGWARKGLVVFQFALSVIFLVAVVVVYQQTRYVQTAQLGYAKDNVLYFELEGKVKQRQESFLSQLKALPGVSSASTIGDNIIGSGENTSTELDWPGRDPQEKFVFEVRPVNYEMIELLDIPLAEGRLFSREFGADSSSIIFNETAIRAMGLKDPVGKVVRIWETPFQIAGVVKDFHFASLHEEIKPLFFILRPSWTHLAMVKLKAGKERETVVQLEKLYRAFNPGFIFNYKFLDQQYEALYRAEERVGTLAGYFAGMAVLISCLGLYGLAAFTAQRRRKEISIRKVLGSDELSIVYLLVSSFTKIVLLAIGIALPVSYLLTFRWLADFAYKMDLQWWYFLGAGAVVLLVSWLTVGFQAVKAALVNPVTTLKSE